MSIKKIINILFHPTTIKIVGMISIIGFFFILPTYAQGTTDASLKSIQEGLNTFISICSRGWIVFAILAGKLMTNDFVYGAFLHMDIYLWKIRNIMKNFANFTLAALVLWSIIKNLTGKEAMNVKDIITKTLIAGILIQASWFLMGAVIDISTVATAGIGAFPTAFLKSDVGLKNEIKDAIDRFKGERILINFNATGNNVVTTIKDDLVNPKSSEDLRQNVLPSYNSVSGPFIFLGMGVFNFQKYLSTDNTTALESLTLGFALRFFLLFFFTVGLILLFLANIMRIGLLRIFIIGSPFLILMQVFKLGEGGSGALKIFSLSNLIAIIFKPVIFVIGISLMLIVIVSMQHGMLSSGAKRETSLNGVTLGQRSGSVSTLTVEGISDVSVDQTDILGKDTLMQGKNFFSEILMLLLALFLMRRFVKLSLTIGGGPIEETMKRLTGLAEGMAKSLPLVPFAGGTSIAALGKTAATQQTEFARGFGMNTQGQFTAAEGKFSDYISDRMHITSSWQQRDYDTLQTTIDTRGDFMGKSIELAGTRQGGLSLTNSSRKDKLEKWLATDSGRKALVANGGQRRGTFKDTFDGEANAANRKALHILMGGDANVASGGIKLGIENKLNISYEQLTNNMYHKPST